LKLSGVRILYSWGYLSLSRC